MTDPKEDKQRDDVLKPMLNTPPDPHMAKKDKASGKPWLLGFLSDV